MKLEFSKLIEKMGLRPEETAPADAAPDVTVTAERITEGSRAREVLELFRKADHVTVLALPDLSGVICGLRYRGGYRPVGGIFLRALHR